MIIETVPPDWLVVRGEIDILDSQDGRWYEGSIKKCGTKPDGDILFTVGYAHYQDSVHSYTDSKHMFIYMYI